MCNIYGVERRVVSRSTMVINTFFLGCYNNDAVLVPFGNRDECQVISKLTQAVHPVAVVIPGGVAIEKVAELRVIVVRIQEKVGVVPQPFNCGFTNRDVVTLCLGE